MTDGAANPSAGEPVPGGTDLGLPGLEGAERVGRGASGSVWRAWQPRFSRWVAVKVLDDAISAGSAERFARECQAVGGLSGHPYVVTVLDAGLLADGRPFLTMPYLPGGSLADVLASRGALPPAEVLEHGIKVASALHAAHAAGVLHRDVKPENVLLSAYDEPQLADFGVARLELASLTRTGTFVATPLHAAPEVLSGRAASAGSDVYGLGSTLFRLLAGRAAFLDEADTSLFPLLSRIASAPPPDLRPLGVPDAVARAVEAMMAKEPGDRPGSALEAGQALQDAQREAGLAVTRAPGLGAAGDGADLPVPEPALTGLPPEPPLLPPAPMPLAWGAAVPTETERPVDAPVDPPVARPAPLARPAPVPAAVPATPSLPAPLPAPAPTAPAYLPGAPSYPPVAPPWVALRDGPSRAAGRSRRGLVAACVVAALVGVGGIAAATTLALSGDSGPEVVVSPSPSLVAPSTSAPSLSLAPSTAAAPTTGLPSTAAPTTTPTTPAGGPTDDVALARSLLLTAAELPAGWVPSTFEDDPERARDNATFASCLREPDVEPDSTAFVGNSFVPRGEVAPQISSQVQVYGDAASVRELIATSANPRVQPCLEGLLRPSLAKGLEPGQTLAALDVVLEDTPTIDGVPVRGLAYHADVTIEQQGTSVDLRVKRVVLAGERAVAYLDFLSLGGSPVDPDIIEEAVVTTYGPARRLAASEARGERGERPAEHAPGPAAPRSRPPQRLQPRAARAASRFPPPQRLRPRAARGRRGDGGGGVAVAGGGSGDGRQGVARRERRAAAG